MSHDPQEKQAGAPNAAWAPSPWLGVFALTAVTAVWGYSFLLVHDAVAVYPVFPFLAVRFTLATLLVSPFLLPRLRRATKGALWGGFWMGTALFSGYAFQTLGLIWTSAAHSGFITGLFVVLTPLFWAFLKRRLPTSGVTFAILLSTAGLAALSWQGSLSEVNVGDALSVCCAVVYAVHLLLTAHMARRHDTGTLVLVQIATVAGLAWVFSIPYAGRLWPIPAAAGTGILVTAIFATAIAYVLQTTFQRYLSPVQTALVFTMEPVFAGLFAVLFGGERLGLKGLVGGVLIVAGMMMGQLTEEKERPEAEALEAALEERTHE